MAEGMAWVWPKYCKLPVCRDWVKIESKAREGNAGLWLDTEPIPPWEWRAHVTAP